MGGATRPEAIPDAATVEQLNPRGAARARAMAPVVRALLDEWAPAPEERTLETAEARTHLLTWGDPAAPPLLVLHGGAACAASWLFQAGALGAIRRVYAPDVPGQYGLSVARRRLRSVADVTGWLDGVLDALGLARVDLLGVSLGGSFAAQYALRAPSRVGRLVLIAPAMTLLPMRPSFYLLNLPVGLFGRWPWAWEYLLRRLGPRTSAGQEPYESRLSMAARWSARAQRVLGITETPFPPVLSDEELGRLPRPALVMAGRHEVIWDAQAALARAAARMPGVRTVLVEGAGHDLLYAQPERVNEALVEFLGPA